MIRAFVAIRVPGEAQRSLAAEQRRLAEVGIDLRWVRPDNIHLTLVFLGNVEEERVAEIEAGMRAAAAEVHPFHLAVSGLGCFPPRGTTRVLWAGLEGRIDALHALQLGIDRRLRRAGFAHQEQAFRPHLTLGRAGPPRAPTPASALQTHLAGRAPSFGAWQVRDVELIRSQLHYAGSIYTTLFTAPLGAPVAESDDLNVSSDRGGNRLRSADSRKSARYAFHVSGFSGSLRET